MGKYNFDITQSRKGTGSVKWDTGKRIFSGGENFVPMWIADTDFEILPEIIDGIEKRLKHPIFGYTSEPQAFFTSIMEWVKKRHGWKIEKEWVCPADGVVSAAALAINALTQKGDKIVVHTPCYDKFYNVVEQNERILVKNELIKNGDEFSINFESLETEFKNGAKTLLLCNPQNPTGKVWTMEELIKLARLCIKYDVILISDDIHSDIINSKHKYIPVASVDNEILPKTITCYSPGKAFNLAAIKSATIIIPDEEIRKRFKAYQERMFQLKLNALSYEASIAAYTYGEDYIDELNAYIESNTKFADAYIKANIPKIKSHIQEATYLMLWDCKDMNLSGQELVNFFSKNADVGFSGGFSYGVLLNTYVRVNVACTRETLEKALLQIKAAMDK